MISTHTNTQDRHTRTHTHTHTHTQTNTQRHTTNIRRKYHILISNSIFPFSFPFLQIFRLLVSALFSVPHQQLGQEFLCTLQFLERRERPSLYSILTITTVFSSAPATTQIKIMDTKTLALLLKTAVNDISSLSEYHRFFLF